MIEEIFHANQLLAIIIKQNYSHKGIKFFTPPSFSQQLAYINYPKKHIIEPHVHNKVSRNVELTQEVLLVKKGKLKVDIYNNDKVYVQSRILTAGDLILLASGGHGFEMIEDTEMIEIKQGPFCGDSDKSRFTPIDFTK